MPVGLVCFLLRFQLLKSNLVDQLHIVEVAVVPLAEEVAGHAPAGLLVSLDTDEAAEARAGGYRLLCEEAADRVRRNAVMLVPDPLPDRELALLAVGQIGRAHF